MSINFPQVYEKIRSIRQKAQERREQANRQRERALHLLQAWKNEATSLAEKVQKARGYDPTLRCAIPLETALDATFDPAPIDKPLPLLAADGSQIAPNRHAAVFYSLINVGAIVLRPGSNTTPEVFTESNLLFDDEIYTETGLLTEEALNLRRDLAERHKLLELAQRVESACIALTDGPLELWGTEASIGQEYPRYLKTYLDILAAMQGKDILPAGYVDKPSADLVIRLLEIASLADDELKNVRQHHPLRGATDLWLFSNLLQSGQRSAVFGMQSISSNKYTNDLALRFFYINVGDQRHPALARVEIPEWVAKDTAAINAIHVALLEQCRLMGARPYPYILHRAHELAVVRFEEKQQVETMLELELRRAGGEVGEKSGKQLAKDNR